MALIPSADYLAHTEASFGVQDDRTVGATAQRLARLGSARPRRIGANGRRRASSNAENVVWHGDVPHDSIAGCLELIKREECER